MKVSNPGNQPTTVEYEHADVPTATFEMAVEKNALPSQWQWERQVPPLGHQNSRIALFLVSVIANGHNRTCQPTVEYEQTDVSTAN
ncbi:hypothetical protein T03_468 [Trichinella britovi]|uniref:Uncharacterized protein n=1 Tax=Trichinella britovi TaxID=45882 RepID=A0A0V1CH47_TRIBR|nr:hypothetical protein T03_468 [Trichinella britovi]